jgi:hypothetical protein
MIDLNDTLYNFFSAMTFGFIVTFTFAFVVALLIKIVDDEYGNLNVLALVTLIAYTVASFYLYPESLHSLSDFIKLLAH